MSAVDIDTLPPEKEVDNMPSPARTEIDLKRAIARLEAEVNGGIADEARRAGATAEWYRDLQGTNLGQ